MNGWRVLVPRAATQAGPLVAALRAAGAEPVEVPVIVIEPPADVAALAAARASLARGDYDWVGFTSANAVTATLDEIVPPPAARVAAVGPRTAAVLRERGVTVDLLPETATAAGLAAAWPAGDGAVLLPRSDIAAPELVEALRTKGWRVDDVVAYRTVGAGALAPGVRAGIAAGDYDAVVFTSPSTVRHFLDLCGAPHPRTLVAVIGPRTAAAARAAGLNVAAEAAEPTPAGLVAALAGPMERIDS